MTRSRKLNVRVSGELHQRLLEAARTERRTLSDMVRVVLEQWLTDYPGRNP